jgi:uncharacterized integral membrane protein
VRAVHWFVTLPLTILLVVFAISNRQAVEITFWPLPVAIETRLFLVVLLAIAAGFVFGELVAWLGGRRWRRETREKARRIDALERELAATQARLKSQTLQSQTLQSQTLQSQTGASPAAGGLLMKQS